MRRATRRRLAATSAGHVAAVQIRRASCRRRRALGAGNASTRPRRARRPGRDLEPAATARDRLSTGHGAALGRYVSAASSLAVGVGAGRRFIARAAGHPPARAAGRRPAPGRRRRLRPSDRAAGPRRDRRARRRHRGDAPADRPSSRPLGRRWTERSTRRPRSSRAPTPSSSSSPTSPRTTSRSRCARWPASASCSQRRYSGQLDERADAVHRLRRRRREADAGADQRPARLLAGRPHAAASAEPVDAGDARRQARRRPRGGDRGDERRASRPAPLPDGRGERDAARRRLPEPDRQRAQVPRRRRAAASACRAERRRRATGEFPCADNGIGIEPRVRRADLRHLPAPARQGAPTTGPASAWPCAGRSSSTTAGSIWLDADPTGAARHFRFTLPAPDEEPDVNMTRRNRHADRGPAGRGRPGRRR